YEEREPVRVRPAHGDDLRVSDRDVGDCWWCWWTGTDDNDESQRAGATTRDGCDASARCDAADRVADDRGGGSCDWPTELDHRGVARVAGQQGDRGLVGQDDVSQWVGFYV